MIAYTADKIFTGSNWLVDHAILVEDSIIVDIVPTIYIPEIYSVKHYGACVIAPAFVDIQIYGAMGSLLGVQPTIETLQKMYTYCSGGGAAYFLPTVATNTTAVFHNCINAVTAYWNKGGQGVLGLHIEGPWINKEKRGAHIESLIHSPTIDEVKALLERGKGVIKMITLAPEVCSSEIVDLIQSYGVIVSAGHSNATYQQATHAFNNGILAATHLYNAMSGLQHREPGLAGALFNHAKVMCSIIPDGYHVDFAAVSIAKKIMGDRLFIITDAVTETSEGPYPHQAEGDKYVANGILSGSALTMMKAVKNCVEYCDIPLGEALKMASTYPAKVLGLQKTGKLKKGYPASFVAINKSLQVAATIGFS